MNLRSLWSTVRDKSTSDALDYITKRINLVWRRQHVSSGADEGLHVFAGAPVPFDATMFGSETAGQTWTLAATDQVTYRLVNLGGWVFVTGVFFGTVAGAGGATLTIRLPLGIRGPSTNISGAGWCTDAGVAQLMFVAVNGIGGSSQDAIRVGKIPFGNWTNGAIGVRFMAFWEQRPLT